MYIKHQSFILLQLEITTTIRILVKHCKKKGKEKKEKRNKGKKKNDWHLRFFFSFLSVCYDEKNRKNRVEDEGQLVLFSR